MNNSTSSSLLRDLLSRPSSSTQPPTDQPSSSTQPPTETSSAPPPPTIEEDAPVPVIHLSEDEDDEWELVRISIAHPNFDINNPDHIAEALCTTLPPPSPQSRELLLYPPSTSSAPPPTIHEDSPAPPTIHEDSPAPPTIHEDSPAPPTIHEDSPASLSPQSPSPPLSMMSSPLPDLPQTLVSPLPPTPPALTPYLPAAAYYDFQPATPTHLPRRRIQRHQLWRDVYYEVHTWETVGNHHIFHIYDLGYENILELHLPRSIEPTQDQLIHHLFTSSIYLRITQIHGRSTVTFHP